MAIFIAMKFILKLMKIRKCLHLFVALVDALRQFSQIGKLREYTNKIIGKGFGYGSNFNFYGEKTILGEVEKIRMDHRFIALKIKKKLNL